MIGRANPGSWPFCSQSKSAYSIAEMASMVAQTPFGKGKIDVTGVGFQVWLENNSMQENALPWLAGRQFLS